jgi:hypothetical protein
MKISLFDMKNEMNLINEKFQMQSYAQKAIESLSSRDKVDGAKTDR